MKKPDSKLTLRVISLVLCVALFAPVPAHAGLGDLFAAIRLNHFRPDRRHSDANHHSADQHSVAL